MRLGPDRANCLMARERFGFVSKFRRGLGGYANVPAVRVDESASDALAAVSWRPIVDQVVIDKLEFLIAVAKEKSFSRAAEVCGVTQPTLSAGVKQLEDSLGVLLVNRSSRFHGLTAEGERVLDWAKRIVGDARAMRQEVRALKEGLTGQLKIAVIPTALGIVSALTTPYREKHPGVRFSVISASSSEVLTMLDNLEIDAGITYLDNEPLGRVRTVPLCSERYRLLTFAGNPLGSRDRVTWADVGRIDLCLLTPDMQNRRIVEQLIRKGGSEPAPILESNDVILLFDHVRSGRWATVLPEKLAKTLNVAAPLRSIPIVEPEAVHEIGLVAPQREPVIPLVAALVSEAKKLAESHTLDA
ncbi:MAG: LysR family transcriptional regulator [Methylocystaceae bacterium]|nr:MAG: LysR family transcriptional regulator [Methylocystaceae bacterium]KAF0211882.1 MAG: LysR family transcriptional [Methylocystaceae bacterium]TXT46728.1 MAG: LysR family transcriptional regulator [Methylocystaceae bacterium]